MQNIVGLLQMTGCGNEQEITKAKGEEYCRRNGVKPQYAVANKGQREYGRSCPGKLCSTGCKWSFRRL
jgi:hypothetical protein